MNHASNVNGPISTQQSKSTTKGWLRSTLINGTLFVLLIGGVSMDELISRARTVRLRGVPTDGDLPEELRLSGKYAPDFLQAGEQYVLTILNATSTDLKHCMIELNGREQPLPSFEQDFPAGAKCRLFFNHDNSNLKQGWSKPRADGHLYPLTLKFACDEFNGTWTIEPE